MVEQCLDKALVASSILAGGTIHKEINMAIIVVLVIFVVLYFVLRKF